MLAFKKARVERERQREYERISDEIRLVHAKPTSLSLPPFPERVSSISLSSTVHPAPLLSTPHLRVLIHHSQGQPVCQSLASTFSEKHSDNQLQDSAMCSMLVPKALQRVEDITPKLRPQARAARAKEDWTRKLHEEIANHPETMARLEREIRDKASLIPDIYFPSL